MHFASLVASAVALAALPTALGHAYIMEPAAVWKRGFPDNGYSAEVNALIFGPIDFTTFGYGPEGSLKYYDAFMKNSTKYSSLRDLIMKEQRVLEEYQSDAECGHTDKDESKRETLPAEIKTSGFTHPGPCEIYCDDVKLASALDCQKAYPSGSVPIDTSKCVGSDRLTLYWIGIHGDPWQVYTNCVYLKGSTGGGASPSTAPSTAPSTKPSTAPSAQPSTAPSVSPSANPSAAPSTKPSAKPSAKPSTAPTTKPSTNCRRRQRRE
ncbi:hypothetical protein Poli38472_012124 [Pythium oligandrum]|uniref:Circumsporozoite protein n=1 Tax=Pythium oligandrum TaxID=41045 RepID=A0A8K1CQ97_PYTOL|nr:hypothetical protein Poli38472_012124 [Pythium oligandrum]|eukprot:TMW67008.1 hypothetical protein Poli38472_012124 [Pythium oligandrum]